MPERTGEAINCTIIVSDAFGIVSAAPSDFLVSSSNNTSASLDSSDGGLSYTFSATPMERDIRVV